jgi:hypothetical protein
MRRSYAFLTNMAAAIVALSVGGTTRAQVAQVDATKTIAMCAGISSDLQRLSCYDDLSRQDRAQNKTSLPPENSTTAPTAMAPATTAAGSLTNSADSGSLGAWVRNDEVDGLDSSKIIILSLPAESGNVGLIGK